MAPYKSRPTIRKRLLGRRLATARAACGLTVEAVAEKAGSAPSSISRMESGHIAVKPSMVDFFAKLYGIDDEREIERLRQFARRAKERGPWTRTEKTIGPTYYDLIDAEDMSEEIRTWQPMVIPGLLQTTDYSEVLIRGTENSFTGPPENYPLEEFIRLREERKKILRREKPPKVWAIIGEAALRTPVGEPAVMKAQVQHLLNLGETHVTIQVLQFESGPHSGMVGGFLVFTIDGDEIAYSDTPMIDGAFNDSEEDVRSQRTGFEQLGAQALSPQHTRRFLHSVLQDL